MKPWCPWTLTATGSWNQDVPLDIPRPRSTRISAASCCRTGIALMKSLTTKILTSSLPNPFHPRLAPAALGSPRPAPSSKRSRRAALHRSRNQHFLLWGHYSYLTEVAESSTKSWVKTVGWGITGRHTIALQALTWATRCSLKASSVAQSRTSSVQGLGGECGQLVTFPQVVFVDRSCPVDENRGQYESSLPLQASSSFVKGNHGSREQLTL